MDKAREAMFLKEHRKNEQQQPKIRELSRRTQNRKQSIGRQRPRFRDRQLFRPYFSKKAGQFCPLGERKDDGSNTATPLPTLI